jgi:hypothetical protein
MILIEIAAFLQAQGIGEVDHDIFMGARPETPDACLTVAERPSLPPMSIQGNLLAMERPRLQIICRGAADDYLGPRTLAERAYRALALILNSTLTNTYYQSVIPSPPFVIGRDANARYLICVNAEVTKNPS